MNNLDFEGTIALGTNALITSIPNLDSRSQIIPGLYPTSIPSLSFLSCTHSNHQFIFPFSFPRFFNTESTITFLYCSINPLIHTRILLNSFPTAFSVEWCETFQINYCLAKL